MNQKTRTVADCFVPRNQVVRRTWSCEPAPRKLIWVHLNFEENQNIVAFWEWGIVHGELAHKVFLQRFDAPN